MASLTTAQIQTKLDNLSTTYDSLSADAATSRSSANGRSHTLRELKEVQEQIVYWEGRLNESTRVASTFTQGRPTR